MARALSPAMPATPAREVGTFAVSLVDESVGCRNPSWAQRP